MQTTSRWTRHALGVCVAGALLVSCSRQAGVEPVGPVAQVQPNAAGFLGCPYPSGDVWQTNILNARLAPNSAAEIQATIDGGGGGAFNVWMPTDELINTANNSTPLVPVHPKVKYHTPYTPWPWQANFYIEPLGDAHALVLQGQDCEYYEGYSVTYSGSGVLSMYNGGMWPLTKPFVRPAYGGISTESGIPLGLVAVRPEDLSAGVIRHALGWAVVSDSLSQTACVSPAAKTDCTGDLPYHGPPSQAQNAMPFGAHIRLRASFNISGFAREAKIVAVALKNYGAYAYSAGCCNAIVLVDDVYGAPTWTDADEKAIRAITLSDFDVVRAPK